MSFLPIVERELRVRARLKSTYRLRMAGAGAAILIVGFLLVWAQATFSPGRIGSLMFTVLSWLAFLFCLLEGARTTADCLSEEKRAGTLGLLFLTDLRGYDVVLGKLMAHALNSFYGLLAIFPALAIPLLIGGVTVGEFWRLVLVLIATLFFSLTAGIFVSALSRNERTAWSNTVGLVVLFAVVPPLLRWLPTPSVVFLTLASPATPFLRLLDGPYSANPAPYWNSILILHLLSLIFLVTASYVLPHAWQDRPFRAARSRRAARWSLRRNEEANRQRLRHRLLSLHPVVWLAARHEGGRFLVWVAVGGFAAVAIGLWVLSDGFAPVMVGLFAGAWALHFALAVWVASQACYLMANSRDSGAFELLLSTPVTVQEIITGHLLALKRLFFWPVVTLLAVEAALGLGQIFMLARDDWASYEYVWILAAVGLSMLIFALDLNAAARFGFWMGLRSRRPSQAVTKTVLYVLVLPLVPLFCCAVAWPIVAVVKNLLLINYARDHLLRDFRAIITEGISSGGEGGGLAGAVARKEDAALPSVLPR